MKFNTEKTYDACCDSCGWVTILTGEELNRIKSSGYNGPYCEACGERISGYRILEASPNFTCSQDEQ